MDVNDSKVTLSGTVPTYTSLRAAENDALLVPGVTAVYNELLVKRPEELSVPTDSEIKERVENIYRWHESLSTSDLSVQVKNGWVSLEGSTDSYWKKIIAEDLANTAEGVINVKNNIRVLARGVSDEQLARNIQEIIQLRRDIHIKGLDVEVQKGTVTLTGEAETHSDALAAADAAIFSKGVTHVNDKISVRKNTL